MKKNVPIFLRLLLLLSAAGLSFAAQAGGIALGATRVIYPQGSKQTSLPIINSSASNVFLIQSWVANADGSNLNQVSEALGAGYKMNWQDAQTIVSTPYTVENGLRMVRIENVNVETAEISEVAPAQRGFRPSKVMKNVNLLRIMCDQPAEATRLIPSLEQYAGKMVLNPALSPDGKKIAFQIVSYGLFVCDVDGANLKSFGKGAYPSWAPNSTDLMFARIQDNGERFTASDLFSVNTETGVEENLTPNSDVIPITLSVSPDGSKVAFDNDVDGNIYVVDLK